MKTILLTTTAILLGIASASAADLAARPYTKAPVMAPTWNWSGFYFGGNVGYGIAHNETAQGIFAGTPPTVLLGATTGPVASDGVIGGVQIGWNTMFAPSWLFGIEADIQGADVKGSQRFVSGVLFTPGDFAAVESRLNWFGTVRGRLGWTATPETLLYVTGGLAYGEVETRNSSSFAIGGGVLETAAASLKSTKTGWTVGGGIETRLWNSNWTAKAEYLYVDLGSQTLVNSTGPVTAFAHGSDVESRTHIIRAGLNYKFNSWN
ncbi:porin family protein [Tardiphaga alba]|uniref:Porin family protein n=1 Tax=Tardiphaga alba TaxID=340268 RepID=A0ABX8A9D3_9BRAD|nr:outer membrane beta-barrel protein [Tardiphaga alba]QUS40343.1 porin family protein [Tardiphaga alba]